MHLKEYGFDVFKFKDKIITNYYRPLLTVLVKCLTKDKCKVTHTEVFLVPGANDVSGNKLMSCICF